MLDLGRYVYSIKSVGHSNGVLVMGFLCNGDLSRHSFYVMVIYMEILH